LAPPDAVLLIAFGGPEKPEDIRPFLDIVLRGRPVPPARYEDVVRHYEEIGGRSPLNELTFRQRDALAAELARSGATLPVYVGMRNWSPFIDETLRRMCDDGIRRAVGVILAAHRTEASWQRYTGAVADAREALGADAPAVEYAGRWFDHPLFIEAMVRRTEEALAALASDGAAGDGAPPQLVFTAHSIPSAMAESSPYVAELTTSCRLVAAALGRTEFILAYQSRSGSPRDPWLEPDVNDVIRDCARAGTRAIVLVPIGFVCDHVEVLYDLDVEARATAVAAGVRLARAATANDHPAFVRMLADVVRAHVGRG
jgi:ferrochelatase